MYHFLFDILIIIWYSLIYLTVIYLLDTHVFCYFQVTIIVLVPPIFVAMLKSPITTNYDLSSVRRYHCGAAPLTFDTEAEFKQKFEVKEIHQGIIIVDALSIFQLKFEYNIFSYFNNLIWFFFFFHLYSDKYRQYLPRYTIQ